MAVKAGARMSAIEFSKLRRSHLLFYLSTKLLQQGQMAIADVATHVGF
nr:hypothetical protein [Aulosira sp. ZfuVER01]